MAIIWISYDVSAIPCVSSEGPLAALEFRNKARRLIAGALSATGLGQPADLEIGAGRVAIAVTTEDPDAAEACIRRTLSGTAYESFASIDRR